MAKWLTDAGELERLNAFCKGKQIERIEYDAGDNLTLYFTDESEARMSTLGGFEIEELRPNRN